MCLGFHCKAVRIQGKTQQTIWGTGGLSRETVGWEFTLVLKWRHLTREEESLVHSELLSKSDVAEVLLALSDGSDIPTLAEDVRDELLSSVFRQTTDEYRLTPWRAFPRGRRRKVCQTWRRKGRGRNVISNEGTVVAATLQGKSSSGWAYKTPQIHAGQHQWIMFSKKSENRKKKPIWDNLRDFHHQSLRTSCLPKKKKNMTVKTHTLYCFGAHKFNRPSFLLFPAFDTTGPSYPRFVSTAYRKITKHSFSQY